jgi:hypothetical protein
MVLFAMIILCLRRLTPTIVDWTPKSGDGTKSLVIIIIVTIIAPFYISFLLLHL